MPGSAMKTTAAEATSRSSASLGSRGKRCEREEQNRYKNAPHTCDYTPISEQGFTATPG